MVNIILKADHETHHVCRAPAVPRDDAVGPRGASTATRSTTASGAPTSCSTTQIERIFGISGLFTKK